MRAPRHIIARMAGRFRRTEDGAALVEFAISLPLMLMVAFGTIDAMRLFWSYQNAITGVRDAARYVARVAPPGICDPMGSIEGYEPLLSTMIGSARDGGGIYTAGTRITDVRADLSCNTALNLRQPSVPVATVEADFEIALPFTEVFRAAGGNGLGTIRITISEQARIFGL